MSRFLAEDAGSWDIAAEMPYREAFAWATDKLRRKREDDFKFRTLVWASHLGLYSMGGKPPKPPAFDPTEE